MEKISEWFKANKLLLNIKKANYTLFHKNNTKDDLPLKLLDLKIFNNVLKRQTSWKEHIKATANKLSKNIGLLCKTKQLPDHESLKSICLSYIIYYSYIIHYSANIAWASTDPKKLKKYIIYRKATQIINNENRLCHSGPLLKNRNALNVYQINLYQNLNFIQRIKMANIPEGFHEAIKKSNYEYPTTFSNLSYSI